MNNAGVEDPRTTWVPGLGRHLMTYVAYGPLGPRLALAVSEDLETWRRLGPVQFAYQPGLDTDLNLFPNKDAVFFPEPVPDPDGRPSYAMLHRPMWDLGWFRPGEGVHLPAGITDERAGIWISYVPADEVEADLTALVRPRHHRCVALPQFAYEALKIGAGPPPLRVPEGWLVIHHGVLGTVRHGDIGPQGASPAPGALLPVTLTRELPADRTDLTAIAAGGEAVVDAVILEPLISRYVIAGRSRTTALLRSAARTPETVTVAVPGAGPALIETYDSTGVRRSRTRTSGAAVRALVLPGGFTVIRR